MLGSHCPGEAARCNKRECWGDAELNYGLSLITNLLVRL